MEKKTYNKIIPQIQAIYKDKPVYCPCINKPLKNDYYNLYQHTLTKKHKKYMIDKDLLEEVKNNYSTLHLTFFDPKLKNYILNKMIDNDYIDPEDIDN